VSEGLNLQEIICLVSVKTQNLQDTVYCQSKHEIFKKPIFNIGQDTKSSRNMCLISEKTQNLQENVCLASVKTQNVKESLCIVSAKTQNL
jgi:hypothetical protein